MIKEESNIDDLYKTNEIEFIFKTDFSWYSSKEILERFNQIGITYHDFEKQEVFSWDNWLYCVALPKIGISKKLTRNCKYELKDLMCHLKE